jgi:hypothetical protein
MRIHSDTLTPEILRECLNRDPRFKDSGAAIWRLNTHASRSRARAFEVRIGADAGRDIHGKARRHANSGVWGSESETFGYAGGNFTDKALTYAEWGFWIANVFEFDPAAIVGPYKGVDDFAAQTGRWGALQQNDGQPFASCDWAYDNGVARDLHGVMVGN